jgi:hypothetical protein
MKPLYSSFIVIDLLSIATPENKRRKQGRKKGCCCTSPETFVPPC